MDTASNTTTIFGADVKVEGPVLRFAGPVHVYGSVVGDVDVDGELVVGNGGSILGDVRARSAQVGGRLKGDVDCGRFEILSTGAVVGVIRAERWSVEPGAVIEAEFVHAKRPEFAARAAEVEQAYTAALRVASELSGNEYRPSDDFRAWAKRLKTAGGLSGSTAGDDPSPSAESAEKTGSGGSGETGLEEYSAKDGSGEDRDLAEPGVSGDGGAGSKAGRFADSEAVGRLAWSKSVADSRGKRIWPDREEDEAPDLFDGEGRDQGRQGPPG